MKGKLLVFGMLLSVGASSAVADTAWPRAGYMGEYGAFHRIVLRPRGKGETGFVQ